jgi:alkylation response protein AidB-like acyl-CoA dehydrogenase
MTLTTNAPDASDVAVGAADPDATLGAAALEFRAYLAEAAPAFFATWGAEKSFEAGMAWQRMLNDGGWAAPSWPTEAGGRGLDVIDRTQCDMELAKADGPVVAGILGINNVGPALFLFGSEQQRASLPKILSGEEVWAQGFSEPGAGSDLAALRTRAEKVEGGFVVNGQKVWTSRGMQATNMMLLVRTDPDAPKHKGISVLMIDMSTAGIERRPLRQITGESEFAEVFFTDVFIPEECLLGEVNKGWGVTMTTLGYERSGVIAMAARLERDIQNAVAGLTITDPILRDEVTQRWMEGRLTGLLGARALAALAGGQPPGAEQSIIKFAWSQASAHLGETLVDAAGPQALLAGDPAMYQFLSTRAATIAAGTTEVMRDILSERILGMPKG